MDLKNFNFETVTYICEICGDVISYSRVHDLKDNRNTIVAYCAQCGKPTNFKLSYRNLH